MLKKWPLKKCGNFLKGWFLSYGCVVSFLFHNNASIQKGPSPQSEAHFPPKCLHAQDEITDMTRPWDHRYWSQLTNSPRAEDAVKKIASYLERTCWSLGTASAREVWTMTRLFKNVWISHALTSCHAVIRFSSKGKAAAALPDISTVAGQEVM